MSDYKKFLENKRILHPPSGFEVGELNPKLFDFQKEIISWACRRGKAAIFCDCGMGKSFMQLEWARCVPGNVLILAPLAVAKQTVQEGRKFGIEATYARDQKQVSGKITITNYEMLEHFDPSEFQGIVLDESSILKSYEGKFRNRIIESFSDTPYRLACTATPAPNDYMELGNHSEFLGILSRTEMLSMFFVHDGGETQKWRLKGHAEKDYWEWVCSWAVYVRKPSDLGYEDGAFILPKLNIQEVVVDAGMSGEYLFPLPASTLEERLKARKHSVQERSNEISRLINGSKDQWLIWCNLNNEADACQKLIRGSVQVKGSDSADEKANRLNDFADGKLKVLVTKPSIAGFGMNFQSCHNVAFVGLSDSWEEFYQAIRRCWRFGQRKPVNVHIVISSQEGAVLSNIMRKEKDAQNMAEQMTKRMGEIMRRNLKSAFRNESVYKTKVKDSDKFQMIHGDCVEKTAELESDSIHYSIFSPPFSSLYTYSESERDMGNSKTEEEFMEHFGFLVKELYRVLIPGRLLSFHVMNLPTSKVRHGVIGIRDFRGDLIRLFESHGFIYHSEVCIWKDPVTAMQRTKALGLLHKQLKKDAAMSRQGIPDYLVTMRKPGENPEPVKNTNETFPVQLWQNYASPVWMDINPSDTLQYRSAREHKDERHICPLQLQVIERAVKLWANEDDVVLSPFAGIGSEGFVALEMGRRFIGIELKESYYNQAVKNLEVAEKKSSEKLLIEV